MADTVEEKAQEDVEVLRFEVEELIRNSKADLQTGDLRAKVLVLVPVFEALRLVGKALISAIDAPAARDRILYYFCKYPQTIISGTELLVVSGIQEYARRLRELRVEFGWSIVSGNTIKDMYKDDPDEVPNELMGMEPDQYYLLNVEKDLEAAYRWNVAHEIRKGKGSIRDKILQFLRQNVGKNVTNEELRYVAGDKTEWARRVRELRTEHGWPIVTKVTGQPKLGVGVYVLVDDRQSPVHDRVIPDPVRRRVLRRDDYKCLECQWSNQLWNPSDPRHLEIHHLTAHAKGGTNDEANLITLCTSCHDVIHQHKA